MDDMAERRAANAANNKAANIRANSMLGMGMARKLMS